MSSESKTQQLKAFIPKPYRRWIRDARFRELDNVILLYTKAHLSSDVRGRTWLTPRRLSQLKKKISKKFGVPVEVMEAKGDSHIALEEGILEILNRSYDGKLLTLTFSYISRDTVDAFLLLSVPDDFFQSKIAESLESLLAEAQLRLEGIFWTFQNSLPLSRMSLLKTVRVFQPTSVAEISSKVKLKGIQTSEAEIQTMLDTIRKKGLVVRDAFGRYSVTATGLEINLVTTPFMNRDIDRVLALGRKKWSD